LQYVRSRHFQYQDANGKWHEDPSSDLGRIARQQDFLRRTLTAASKQGMLKPKIISSLYASYSNDIVVDTGMTIDKMIEFVGVVRKVTPAAIRTYQIEATGKIISGADVLIWHKDSKNMQAILDIFRGVAPLADAPVQSFDTTAASTTTAADTTTTLAKTTTTAKSPVPPAITAVPAPSTTASASTTPGASTTAAATSDTAPQSNTPRSAIVPDPAVEC
ncbi:MAG: hypothetical protein ACXVLX_14955, partial [Ilumatobacteraceae bacterium]